MPLTQEEFTNATLDALREILRNASNDEIRGPGEDQYLKKYKVYKGKVQIFRVEKQAMVYDDGSPAPSDYTLYVDDEPVKLGFGEAEKLFDEIAAEKRTRNNMAYDAAKNDAAKKYQTEIITFLNQFEPKIEDIPALPMKEYDFKDFVQAHLEKVIATKNSTFKETGDQYSGYNSVYQSGRVIFQVKRQAMKSHFDGKPAPDEHTLYINGKEFRLLYGRATDLYNKIHEENFNRRVTEAQVRRDNERDAQQQGVLGFLNGFRETPRF